MHKTTLDSRNLVSFVSVQCIVNPEMSNLELKENESSLNKCGKPMDQVK